LKDTGDNDEDNTGTRTITPAHRRPPTQLTQLSQTDSTIEDSLETTAPIVTPARPNPRSYARSVPASASRSRESSDSQSRAVPASASRPRESSDSQSRARSVPAFASRPRENSESQLPPRQRLRFQGTAPRQPPRTRLPLTGNATNGPWKIVWDIPAEAQEIHLNVLVNAAKDDLLWSEEFTPVQEQRIQIRQEGEPVLDGSEIVPALAGLSDQSRTRLNPKTVEIYGPGLQSMNIDSILPIQDILKQEGNGAFTVKQTKFDMTFIAMPSVGKRPSIRNSAGVHFTSPTLWHNAIQYRYVKLLHFYWIILQIYNLKDTCRREIQCHLWSYVSRHHNRFFIQMISKTTSVYFTLLSKGKATHCSSTRNISNMCSSMKFPVIAPDWYYMALYDDIAIVMLKMMTSPVVMS
jgi:hypothetical protein